MAHEVHVLRSGILFVSLLVPNYLLQNNYKNSARFAIKMISKYFSNKELNDIITACYYSVLYYNADIWMIPSLSPALKQKLLAASSQVLRISTRNFDRMTSYQRLHSIAKRATPDQICQYKHALLLHKTYNDSDQGKEWLALNINQNFNARNPKFISADTSNYKIGRNITSNRLRSVNNKINLADLNDNVNV